MLGLRLCHRYFKKAEKGSGEINLALSSEILWNTENGIEDLITPILSTCTARGNHEG